MYEILITLSTFLSVSSPTDLGAPKFNDRMEAHDRFKRAGRLAYPALTVGTFSSDPEVARRCIKLLGAFGDKLIKFQGLKDSKIRELLLSDAPAPEVIWKQMPNDDGTISTGGSDLYSLNEEPVRFVELVDLAYALNLVNDSEVVTKTYSRGVVNVIKMRSCNVRHGLETGVGTGTIPQVWLLRKWMNWP